MNVRPLHSKYLV